MKTSNFNWVDSIIDSRDIISRYEELNDEYESLKESLEEANDSIKEFNMRNGHTDLTDEEIEELQELQEALDEAQGLLDDFEKFDDKEELDMLKEIVSQGEDCSDWSYGTNLIHDDYFTEYTEELVHDCYEMPKELSEGKWPWCHVKMDWDAAAEELKSDYTTIEVNGETYYIRS
jgi:hypothetical protein